MIPTLEEEVYSESVSHYNCISSSAFHSTTYNRAGLVPWSRSELNNIFKMWSTGYKQGWYNNAAREAVATPMILSDDYAGRDCPSAIEVWTQDALDLYNQCLSLPGEISQLFHTKHVWTTDVGLSTSSND